MTTNYEECIRRLDRMIESIQGSCSAGVLSAEIAEMQLNEYKAMRNELQCIMSRGPDDAEIQLLQEEFVLNGDVFARDIPLAFTTIAYEQFPWQEGEY